MSLEILGPGFRVLGSGFLGPGSLGPGSCLLGPRVLGLGVSGPHFRLCPYLFHRNSCSNFCVKNTVLNARKLLEPSHFFMGNVLILQFGNSHCIYSLSPVDFLEEQLQTFALARVTFGTTALSECLWLELSLGVRLILKTATLRSIYLKYQVFVKTMHIFFQNTTCSRPFFKLVCHFI